MRVGYLFGSRAILYSTNHRAKQKRQRKNKVLKDDLIELDDLDSAMKAKLDELEDTRYEAVFELGWQANKSLSFEGWYSYLNSTTKKAKEALEANNTDDLKQSKQTIRLQAKYRF